MFVIGVTGGIGCGKTTASNYFRQRGVTVLDADEISREITAKDGPAIPSIAAAFGQDYISGDGSMDRKKMAALTFSDYKCLDKLSKIIHQFVLDILKSEVERARKRKEKAIVLDVPVPVKHGFVDLCDFIIVIWANEETRIQRLNKRGMKREEAFRRMAMQMTEEEYAALGQLVIHNDGDQEALWKELDNFCEKELQSRGIRLEVVNESAFIQANEPPT